MSALRPTTALTLRSAAKFARDYQSPCMMSSEASKVRVLAQKTRLNASSQQGLLTEGKIMSDADCPGLSAHQVRKYQEDGYLILPGFVSPEELDGLQTRMEELIAGFNPKDISIFSTKKQNQKIDNYFLQSGNNISFFFEEDAFDEDGNLVQALNKSINKVGHALHDLDPVFSSLTRSKKMASTLRSIGFKSPRAVQSMYIFKQPNIGGEVVPHQDSTFLWTDPEPSCVGLWLALEDSTRDNGCLWAHPGSHRGGGHKGVYRRFVLRDGAVCFENADPSGDPEDMPDIPFDEEAFVPLECPRGTLVLLHGAVLHYSKKNTSPKSRHAYTVHVVEGADGTMWSDRNWLQRRPDFPFVPLF